MPCCGVPDGGEYIVLPLLIAGGGKVGVPVADGGETIVCEGGEGFGSSAEVDGGPDRVVFGIGPAGAG